MTRNIFMTDFGEVAISPYEALRWEMWRERARPRLWGFFRDHDAEAKMNAFAADCTKVARARWEAGA